jgi:hypothetical protein
MNEIERLRLEPAVEQIVDDELYVGDSFRVEKLTRGVEEALVDVEAHDLPRAPDPLAEDEEPAKGAASDVQGAFAGSVVELREELPSGGLPHERLKPQTLQPRRLVGQQVLLRHRVQYDWSSMPHVW